MVTATPSGASTLVYASPAVHKLARALGVSLAAVQGAGQHGRITVEDVRVHVERTLRGQSTARAASVPDIAPLPREDFTRFGPTERRVLSRIRKRSGAVLHRNWVQIPHVTNHEDADITELESFRLGLNREHRPSGVKFTLLALIIKACIVALKQYPEFNASLDGDALILKHYFHIGFAADTADGLVVPVIRDADQKGLLALATESAALAAKARAGKLTATEMSGGSFTISSLGGIGGSYFTPIINAPEVAILGVGKAQPRASWDGAQSLARLILPLSLSWDHRAVDGAAAGRCNACLARVLTDFRLALL